MSNIKLSFAVITEDGPIYLGWDSFESSSSIPEQILSEIEESEENGFEYSPEVTVPSFEGDFEIELVQLIDEEGEVIWEDKEFDFSSVTEF